MTGIPSLLRFEYYRDSKIYPIDPNGKSWKPMLQDRRLWSWERTRCAIKLRFYWLRSVGHWTQ
jgi:hypothetical protein